ncbi:MAG: hypothetical protein A2189_09650 [Paenibacillus sp. RIFOXYA1_FULL_44_5]|nr:MAG: hypothetical protein A2189_09650 [Paenibacillus sp. RIFOXYA1_FULL_44_5]
MEIQINSITLCMVSSSSMSDVYNVLGKHSISFHLDQDNERLNMVSPVHGIQVVIEKESMESTSLVNKIRYDLEQAGFFVYIVEDEEQRKRCLSQLDEEKQGIWISILQDEPKGNGITAYFSFHQMKLSKQFAQLLLRNITKMTDLPVNEVLFEWKNIINSIFPLSGPLQQIPTIGVAFNSLSSLSERYLESLAKGMTRTFFSFFNQLDWFEVIQYVQTHHTSMSNVQNSPVEQELVSEMAYIAVSDQKSEPEEKQQDQVQEKNYEQAGEKSPNPPQYSTFPWLYLHMVKKDGQLGGNGAKTASFMSYVNILEQEKNPKTEKNEPQQINCEQQFKFP